MISGDEIPRLIEHLVLRQVSLYHACQFNDFKSYLELGGIPSRELLELKQSTYTHFETDDVDHENGVWDKVFVNLSDFGEWFAKGRNAVPNPYGPILLVIDPRALIHATDIAISLRSAGGTGFVREQDSLCSLNDIDKLFSYSYNSPFPKCRQIQSTQKLREIFNFSQAQNPEISCTMKKQIIPDNYVKFCIVDPYTIDSLELIKIVEGEKNRYEKKRFSLKRRICPRARIEFYNELVEILCTEELSAIDINKARPQITSTMHKWMTRLIKNKLQYQLRRYETYLKEGTINPLIEMQRNNLITPEFYQTSAIEEEFDDDEIYFSHFDEISLDDLPPEGMGLEDIDWDSFNFDS